MTPGAIGTSTSDRWQIEPVTEPDLHDAEALAEHLATLYHARCADVADHPRVW